MGLVDRGSWSGVPTTVSNCISTLRALLSHSHTDAQTIAQVHLHIALGLLPRSDISSKAVEYVAWLLRTPGCC